MDDDERENGLAYELKIEMDFKGENCTHVSTNNKHIEQQKEKAKNGLGKI